MRRLTAAIGDLRALGSSAPMRAVYEGSKRTGLHAVLFRELRDPGLQSRPIGLGGHVPQSPLARKRCLDDARETLAEGVRVFGRRVPTGVHLPWNVDPLTGQEWPQLLKWWRIDIRSDARMSDVKWVWEAARHRDVVVLARAAAIESGGSWLHELEAMLTSWVDQCPAERGVNWYSSLELALRAVAWAQVIELVGEQLSAELRLRLDAQLVASARHIMVELPYTVSSMKNNHLLGDGLGLVVLGRMFPGHPGSVRWRRVGDRLFLAQLSRHMHPDGSMIEDSLSYHRFVLEMLAVRVLLGDADSRVQSALAVAAHHLRKIGVLEGDVPQYGDWDEGRVLADSAPAGSVAGSTLLGLALTGQALPRGLWDEYDELAWYASNQLAEQGEPLIALPPHRKSGAFHVASRGAWSVWLKSGSQTSHQHADVSSLWVARDGRWVTRDPGTGTYNGPIEVRNGFRTSQAHPVWCPRGLDQMAPHRAFRWLRTVNTAAAMQHDDDSVTFLCVHDAFVREDLESRVARWVRLTDEGVLVVDFIEHIGGRDWVMNLPLGQRGDLVESGAQDEVRGRHDPFQGWHSETYGQWSESTWLHWVSREQINVWSVGLAARSDIRGGGAQVGPSHITLEWLPGGAVATRWENGNETRVRVGDG